jgi:hypothetical protein
MNMRTWIRIQIAVVVFTPLFALPAPVAQAANDFGLSNVAVDVGLATEEGAAESAGVAFNARVGKFINAGLGVLGIIFILLMIYAGATWMRALGNATLVEEAKNTIKWAIIGLLVIVSSYVIVDFVISNVISSTLPSEVQEEPN